MWFPVTITESSWAEQFMTAAVHMSSPHWHTLLLNIIESENFPSPLCKSCRISVALISWKLHYKRTWNVALFCATLTIEKTDVAAHCCSICFYIQPPLWPGALLDLGGMKMDNKPINQVLNQLEKYQETTRRLELLRYEIQHLDRVRPHRNDDLSTRSSWR